MKIKIGKPSLLGIPGQSVYAVTSAGHEIEIGKAYVHRYSGWHGGGQRWRFDTDDSRIETTTHDKQKALKAEIMKEVQTIVDLTMPELPIFPDLSPIIAQYA